jgi:diacylglycerol kinase family enzyme
MATAGFGAQITAETPVELKNFLGGGAYTLMGLLKAIDFVPYKGKMKTPDLEIEQTGIIAAVCNGRQAGGGQVLAPKAMINDGLLDVMIVKEVPLGNLTQLRDEIQNPSIEGEYIQYLQTPWLETWSDGVIPVNLDGEPYSSHKIRFEVVPSAIDLIIPEDSPCLK